jgi:hypothetical protein
MINNLANCMMLKKKITAKKENHIYDESTADNKKYPGKALALSKISLRQLWLDFYTGLFRQSPKKKAKPYDA